jgi:hypothetical protein
LIIGRGELLFEPDDLEGSGLGIKGVREVSGDGFELSSDLKKSITNEHVVDCFFRAWDSSVSTVKSYLTFIFTQLYM